MIAGAVASLINPNAPKPKTISAIPIRFTQRASNPSAIFVPSGIEMMIVNETVIIISAACSGE